MQQIHTALCSFGMSGKVFHAPFIHVHPGFHLQAVWERSRSVVKDIYPNVVSYSSYEAILRDPKVELVVVNTPNYTHYDYTKAALLAGKHVIVEKPFTVTSAEGEELLDLAHMQQRLLTVYHNRRWDSDFKTIKKVLEEGWLGEVVEAEVHFDRYRLDLSPKQHKENPGPGTGALYDLGSHLIDQALTLFGMPVAVFADLQTLRPESQVDDYFEVLLYYPLLRVRLHSSYLVREALPGYILHGTKGSFIKHRTDIQETALQAGKMPGTSDWGIEPDEEQGFLHTERDGQVIRKKIISERGYYMDFYDGVYAAIREGASPPVHAMDGLNVIGIIEAAFRSSNERRVIEL